MLLLPIYYHQASKGLYFRAMSPRSRTFPRQPPLVPHTLSPFNSPVFSALIPPGLRPAQNFPMQVGLSPSGVILSKVLDLAPCSSFPRGVCLTFNTSGLWSRLCKLGLFHTNFRWAAACLLIMFQAWVWVVLFALLVHLYGEVWI